MLTISKITDVSVDCAGSRLCVKFNHTGARYHVWLNDAEEPIAPLYKNPPLGTAHSSDGYYAPRRLDLSGSNRLGVDWVMKQVRENNMIELAKVAQCEAAAVALAEARAKTASLVRGALLRETEMLEASGRHVGSLRAEIAILEEASLLRLYHAIMNGGTA